MVDGPFGSPSSNIYRAEHAVLVGTGIGVTPFASILQSIAFRWGEHRGLVSQGTDKVVTKLNLQLSHELI